MKLSERKFKPIEYKLHISKNLGMGQENAYNEEVEIQLG